MFTGIWHTGLHVSDLDRSIAFYRDVLGLRLVHVQDQDNAYTRSLVGYPDARLRVAQLAVPGQRPGVSSHDVELVQYVEPTGDRQDPARYHPGSAHLAFVVDDLLAEHARLTAAGVRFVSAPNKIEAGVNRGGWACYLLDPDEITLELVQPPPHRLGKASAPLAMFLDAGGAQARTSPRWRNVHDEPRIEDASPPCDARTWTPPSFKQHR